MTTLFDEFNARYWHGRLLRYRVLRGHHDGALGLCVDATRTIMLDHTLTGEDLELVLLHEMAHIGERGRRAWPAVQAGGAPPAATGGSRSAPRRP